MFISPVTLQSGPNQPLPSNQQDKDTAFSGVLDTEQTRTRRNGISEGLAMSLEDQARLYRQEQLLSNPGAKSFDYSTGAILDGGEMGWDSRIVKDIEDSILNFRNFFLNGVSGAPKFGMNMDGTLEQRESSPGLLESLVNFLKDLGSALTFGALQADAPEQKHSIGLSFAISKLKEAVGADLIGGVAGSLIQMGEDLILAGWNLTECVGDIFLGGFDPGQKTIDTIFDNGQVAIDYITDVMPGGEAWMRVHAYDLLEGEFPVIYNLKRPEHLMDDPRWQEIQNTPFRKAIETIGSLLADAALIFTISQAITSSDCRHEALPPDAAAKRSSHSAHVMAYGHAVQTRSHLSNC